MNEGDDHKQQTTDQTTVNDLDPFPSDAQILGITRARRTFKTSVGNKENQIVDKPGKSDDEEEDGSLDLAVLEELLQDQAFLELPKLDAKDKEEESADAKSKDNSASRSQSMESKDSKSEDSSDKASHGTPDELADGTIRRKDGPMESDSDSAGHTYHHLQQFKTGMDLDEFFKPQEVPTVNKDPRESPQTFYREWKTKADGAFPQYSRKQQKTAVNGNPYYKKKQVQFM